MNNIKRLSLLLAVMIIMSAVCGCSGTENKNIRAEKIKVEALAYLNNSYSDRFTAKTYTSSNWAYEYESITFKSEKFPHATVEVRIYKNDDGTYSFKDNYYHCYMMDGAVNYGRTLLSEEKATVKVRFRNTVWSDELNGAQTFEEWIAEGTACAEFFVITGNELPTEVQTEMVSKMAEDKVFGTVVFFVTNDENLLEEKNLDEILNNQNKFVVNENKYFITSDFQIETKP